jgi:hypothetical protein
MGLDMYLNRETYIGAEYKHRNVKGKIEITIEGKPVKIDFNKISYIKERVGYWRKANQIHRWMVENIQDGEDDCGEHSLPKEKAKELLAICKEIKEKCPLVKGTVKNGAELSEKTGGKWQDVYEDGKLMENSRIAAKLLPSASGFFFGSTDYDQYYMGDIENTIEIMEYILKDEDETKDYFSEEITYSSSW